MVLRISSTAVSWIQPHVSGKSIINCKANIYLNKYISDYIFSSVGIGPEPVITEQGADRPTSHLDTIIIDCSTTALVHT